MQRSGVLSVVVSLAIALASLVGCKPTTRPGSGDPPGDGGSPPRPPGQSRPVDEAPLAGGSIKLVSGEHPGGVYLEDELFVLDWGRESSNVTIEPSQVAVAAAGNEVLLQLREGDLIASGTGHGFLRRVLGVHRDGERIVIECDPAQLTDAVRAGSLSSELDLSIPDDADPSASGGQPDGGEPLLYAPSVEPLTFSESLKLGQSTARVTGTLAFTPVTSIEVDPSARKLAFSVTGPMQASFALDLDAKASDQQTIEKVLVEKERTWLTWIGPLPVVLTVTAGVKARVTSRSTLEGRIGLGVRQTVEVSEALSYDRRSPSGWTSTSATKIGEPTADKPTAEIKDAELLVEAELTPSVKLTFYGSDVGVGTELPLTLKSTLGVGQYLCGSGVMLSARGLLKARVPFASPADKTWMFLDVEKRVHDLSHLAQWQANCCHAHNIGQAYTPARVRDARGVQLLSLCEVVSEEDPSYRSNIIILDDDDATLGQGYDRNDDGQPVVQVDKLREIRGDLTIDLRKTALNLPNLERVTGDLAIVGGVLAAKEAPSIALPRLREVGGTVNILWMADPALPGSAKLDLTSLATVGTPRLPANVFIRIVGTPSPVLLPALAMADGAGFVTVQCGWSPYEGAPPIPATAKTAGVVSFDKLTAATSVTLANSYGYSGNLDARIPIPAERACRAELPRLAALRRWVRPLDVDPNGGFDDGKLEVRGRFAYQVPALAEVQDFLHLQNDELDPATPGLGNVVGTDLPALRSVGTLHLEAKSDRLLTKGDFVELTFPKLEQVDLFLISARSVPTLDLPALVTLEDGWFDLPGDSPLVSAPLLQRLDRISLKYSTGSVAVSFPALTTSRDLLSFTGAGVRSISLPALAQAGGVSVSSTSITTLMLPAALRVSSMSVSGNLQLPQCLAELLCSRIVGAAGCGVVGNLACKGTCKAGACVPPP